MNISNAVYSEPCSMAVPVAIPVSQFRQMAKSDLCAIASYPHVDTIVTLAYGAKNLWDHVQTRATIRILNARLEAPKRSAAQKLRRARTTQLSRGQKPARQLRAEIKQNLKLQHLKKDVQEGFLFSVLKVGAHRLPQGMSTIIELATLFGCVSLMRVEGMTETQRAAGSVRSTADVAKKMLCVTQACGIALNSVIALLALHVFVQMPPHVQLAGQAISVVTSSITAINTLTTVYENRTKIQSAATAAFAKAYGLVPKRESVCRILNLCFESITLNKCSEFILTEFTIHVLRVKERERSQLFDVD